MKTKPIYCCGCETDVNAILKSGKDIYPHRQDLHSLPFWMCPTCKNFVGCHHKTRNRTAPLGCIPTTELKNARRHLHALIDPLWETGLIGRRALYERISAIVGWNYHTAKTRTVDEAREAYKAAQAIAKELTGAA